MLCQTSSTTTGNITTGSTTTGTASYRIGVVRHLEISESVSLVLLRKNSVTKLSYERSSTYQRDILRHYIYLRLTMKYPLTIIFMRSTSLGKRSEALD